MSRWNLIWLLGIVGTYLVGMSISISAPTNDPELQAKYENVRLVIDVLEEVERKYVTEMDSAKRRELVENMINGGLERLDPHSGYINPEEFLAFQKSNTGKFRGIGIRVGLDRAGQIVVESPIPGTPAYEAGVLAGDLILKIDDEPTDNMTLKKAVEKITTDNGPNVKLTVLHEGERKPVDLLINRAEINIESILGDQRMEKNLKEWDFMIDKQSKIAYIRITQFAENTVKDLIRVVDQLQADGVKGLVLDLRTNPGGLLEAAREASELFLPTGTRIVSTVGRSHQEKALDARRPEGSKAGPYTDYPIAVLVNKFSASASEIVAGALQEAGRAVIIGERTYGKGSVQSVVAMENATSALKLTTATYFVGKDDKKKNIHRFPDSKETDQWGVKPNEGFDVKQSDEERINYLKWRRLRDIVRQPGQAAPKVDENDKVPADFKDRVLDKALDYLRDKIRGGAGGEQPALPQVRDAENLSASAAIGVYHLPAITPRDLRPRAPGRPLPVAAFSEASQTCI